MPKFDMNRVLMPMCTNEINTENIKIKRVHENKIPPLQCDNKQTKKRKSVFYGDLKHHQVEENKFISLPIVPPLNKKIRDYNKDTVGVLRVHNNVANRYISINVDREDMKGVKGISDDDSMKETIPIVMIEDYIQERDNRKSNVRCDDDDDDDDTESDVVHKFKKVSMSNLRACLEQKHKIPLRYRHSNERIRYFNNKRHLPNRKEDDIRGMDDIINFVMKNATTSEKNGLINDEERLFALTPSMNLVQKCVICNKTLYEVSSLIQSKKYAEIVCEGCLEMYDESVKIMNNYEFDDSMSLHSDHQDTMVEETNFKFSNELIESLKKIIE